MMTNSTERTLRRLADRLPDCVSRPGDERYAAATAIWAKPVGRTPCAVVHCRTPQDVQSAVRAARDGDVALSVRGGGHDWAGRALCDGIVIDLSGMNDVVVAADSRSATILGGALAADVVAATDPFGLAAETGSVGAVGMAGLISGRRLWSADRSFWPRARQSHCRGGRPRGRSNYRCRFQQRGGTLLGVARRRQKLRRRDRNAAPPA